MINLGTIRANRIIRACGARKFHASVLRKRYQPDEAWRILHGRGDCRSSYCRSQYVLLASDSDCLRNANVGLSAQVFLGDLRDGVRSEKVVVYMEWLAPADFPVRADPHDSRWWMIPKGLFEQTAYAWQINDYLHEAIAEGHFKLADTVIRLRQLDWDTARIRPVNWLITRIRIVMDLYQKREAELQVLLENERKGLFEEKLPSELEPDLPEMRNFNELLKALVEKNESAFNQALAARMPIREAHFQRGGTVAPIALIDVHGLALCRLARKRGIKPQAGHVYLPLDMLDLES